MTELEIVLHRFSEVESSDEFDLLLEQNRDLLKKVISPHIMQWLSFDVSRPEKRHSSYLVNEILKQGSLTGKDDETRLNQVDKTILMSLRAGAGRDEHLMGDAPDPAFFREPSKIRLNPYL